MSDIRGLIPRHEALVAERKQMTDWLGLPENATMMDVCHKIDDMKNRLAQVNARLDRLIAEMEAYIR